MSPLRVLIVDDDREMRASLEALAQAGGFEVKTLPRALDVAKALPSFRPDVVLSDMRMPGMTGLELLVHLQTMDAPPVVLISAHGDIPMAVEAMQSGAYSFVEKPFEPRRLLTILTHAGEQHRMRQSNARLRARLQELSRLDRILLGQTPAMVALRGLVLDLMDVRAPVLIEGETGTGKELVARALHDLSPAEGPFVAVNSAMLRPDQVEDVARQADGGTLFLDEIAACHLDSQPMLLRLVENGELPGPSGPQKLRLRVIAATNENTETAMSEGRLRPDLYYRLNVAQVTLPPLRARREDITLLAAHFLTAQAQTYEITPPDLTDEDLATLIAHDWPGNVRELRNVCERRVLMARRGAGSIAAALSPDDAGDDIPSTLREAVAAFEREMIGKAITSHEGRMDGVAEALGIGRRTLNEKIVKLGLDKDALL